MQLFTHNLSTSIYKYSLYIYPQNIHMNCLSQGTSIVMNIPNVYLKMELTAQN